MLYSENTDMKIISLVMKAIILIVRKLKYTKWQSSEQKTAEGNCVNLKDCCSSEHFAWFVWCINYGVKWNVENERSPCENRSVDKSYIHWKEILIQQKIMI